MNSRRSVRLVKELLWSRVPTTISNLRRARGSISFGIASKSVDRSTSMYVRMSAALCPQTSRSTLPRPFIVKWHTRRREYRSASKVATSAVRSVDPLFAMMISYSCPGCTSIWRWSFAMHSGSLYSSLKTGMVTSTFTPLNISNNHRFLCVHTNLRRWAANKTIRSRSQPWRQRRILVSP